MLRTCVLETIGQEADTDPMFLGYNSAILSYPLCPQECLLAYYTYFSPSPSLPPLCLSLCSILPRSFVEGVTMYSWLVTVLLLASEANISGGQGAEGLVLCVPVDLDLFPLQVH